MIDAVIANSLLYGVLATPFLVVLLWYGIGRVRKQIKQKRRQRLRASPFPDVWCQILVDDFPLYSQLPTELQQRLQAHIQIFLDEKVIVGRDQQEISDRVRVLVAAQACMLILNKPTDYYPHFETILVYPDAYQTPVTEQNGHVQTTTLSHRSGESWHRGPVVLAWSHVLQGANNSADGYNVVMHEFAHKLDEEDTVMDGTPKFPRSSQYRSWATIFSREYRSLSKSIMNNHKHAIDGYAATSPAEFFAVVTEMFFEKPRQLRRSHPEVYKELSAFYELDPLAWLRN